MHSARLSSQTAPDIQKSKCSDLSGDRAAEDKVQPCQEGTMKRVVERKKQQQIYKLEPVTLRQTTEIENQNLSTKEGGF